MTLRIAADGAPPSIKRLVTRWCNEGLNPRPPEPSGKWTHANPRSNCSPRNTQASVSAGGWSASNWLTRLSTRWVSDWTIVTPFPFRSPQTLPLPREPGLEHGAGGGRGGILVVGRGPAPVLGRTPLEHPRPHRADPRFGGCRGGGPPGRHDRRVDPGTAPGPAPSGRGPSDHRGRLGLDRARAGDHRLGPQQLRPPAPRPPHAELDLRSPDVLPGRPGGRRGPVADPRRGPGGR